METNIGSKITLQSKRNFDSRSGRVQEKSFSFFLDVAARFIDSEHCLEQVDSAQNEA